MTKEEFATRLDNLYAEERKLAVDAKGIIEDIIRERGDMSREDLYGDTEDPDLCWIGDNYHLTGICIKNGEVCFSLNNNEGYPEDFKPEWMEHRDIIHIADFLCGLQY